MAMATSPTRVETLAVAGHVVAEVAAGGLHSLALTTEGLVFSWGRSQFGRLGRLTMAQVRANTKIIKFHICKK